MELVEAGFKPNEETYELKSIAGGSVTLRRLNHGESNELTDLRLSLQLNTADDDDERETSAKTTIRLSRQYSFARAIVDHNLAHKGKKFNLNKRRDVDSLDPVVGDEIAELIDKHHERIEGSDDIPNSEET